jgi:hypothetical protein
MALTEVCAMKKVKLAKGREFTFAAPKRGGGPEPKYPWEEWFSGELLLLEQSVGQADDKGNITTISEKRDYECPTTQMLSKIKAAARRSYKVVQISRKDVDGKPLGEALIIKARPMTDEERQAEDALRIEEKAKAAKAKKAAEANGHTNGQPASKATIKVE